MPVAPIIFSLREKLFTSSIFLQQRPRWTGGLKVTLLPILPWDDSDRPPNISFGIVDKPPIAAQTLPLNYGLCKLNINPVQPSNIRLPSYSSGIPSQPAVVHTLRPLPATKWRISGITKDSTGTVLATCVVDVFKTSDDVIQGTNTSNANGEYLVEVPTQVNHYAVAYKAGSPDVAGTTRNDLSPT